MKDIKLGKAVNLVILLIGVLLVIVSALPIVASYPDLKTILLSVGSSVMATSIVTWLTSYYIVNTSRKKEIIDRWKFSAIYKTRAEMNQESNMSLAACSKNIDIVATGMNNFLSAQGSVLEEKLSLGVAMKIISFSRNTPYITQREIDESIDGTGKATGVMGAEIFQLEQWVEKMKGKYPQADLEIKFMTTYPSFSYLRIDNKVFCGFNLPLRKSQQNMGLVFEADGEGFSYFSKYFYELWENEQYCRSISFGDSKEVLD